VDRIWIARADGSDARPLHPDVFRGEGLFGWMPDGSGLLLSDQRSPLLLVGPDGSVLERWSRDVICPAPCADASDFSVSPAGNTIAYVRRYGNERGESVLAILDLTTSSVTELESTRVTNPTTDCGPGAACPGLNEDPQWSPDGSRMAFARQVITPADGRSGPRTTAAVYVVNADGTGLQRVTPADWFGFNPRWSPDGSRLVVVHVPDRELTQTDIYTVRPDGSQLTALTTDGRSQLPEWTADGRILFVRFDRIDASTFSTHWVMNADGGGRTEVPPELRSLTAAGCVVCVSAEAASVSIEDPLAHWQPMP
jgi:dipeptidyl aminopeptidase/acylaminoacyl peptidase